MRIVLVCLMVAGCANAENEDPVNAQRLMLNEGYSLLYADAEKLDLAKLILYVKAESQEFEEVVRAISEVGEDVKNDLERIAKEYPGVRIDLDPLPEMEKRKRKAIGKDRAREFAPIVGRGGREYERTVLISFSNAFNHERHLCKVMAEEEPDASLKKFLNDTERRYDELYERSMALLEKGYFKPG
ncbi:MAG: hypothetical protein ACT4PZ_01275 [Panacagrimonas sp.]